MFIEPVGQRAGTPAGCYVGHSLICTSVDPAHCTPWGAAQHKPHLYKHCTPLGCSMHHFVTSWNVTL